MDSPRTPTGGRPDTVHTPREPSSAAKGESGSTGPEACVRALLAENDVGLALDHVLDADGSAVARRDVARALACQPSRLTELVSGETASLPRALLIAALTGRPVEELFATAAEEARRVAAAIREDRGWSVAPAERSCGAPSPGASLDERWCVARALESEAPGACAVLGLLVHLGVKYGGAFRVDAVHVASTLRLQWGAARAALSALAGRGLLVIAQAAGGASTVYVVRLPWLDLTPQRSELFDARLG
jgi:hypothetical protein